MAIDTEDKRRSAICHTILVTYPSPGGGVDEGDREHTAGLYRGISSAVAPAADEVFYYAAMSTSPTDYCAEC